MPASAGMAARSRATWCAFVLLVACLSGEAHTAEIRAYDANVFAQRNAEGRPMLIDIRAPWCPTCLVQERSLHAIVAEFGDKDFTILQIDFDLQKSLVQQFKARSQSTLVMFGGGREVARVVGETRKEILRGMVARGVLAANGKWPQK